ncbi:MAG: hypothetical protein ABTQ34_02680 [Bdellovibrionales bacterium]
MTTSFAESDTRASIAFKLFDSSFFVSLSALAAPPKGTNDPESDEPDPVATVVPETDANTGARFAEDVAVKPSEDTLVEPVLVTEEDAVGKGSAEEGDVRDDELIGTTAAADEGVALDEVRANKF